ncbi:MAG: hypothetical protein KAI55_00020 [Candidatus Aenigmarchaeota archaeon]|nr:hypothetical protein [Candidatus Aenigmarchaeota archaeon]
MADKNNISKIKDALAKNILVIGLNRLVKLIKLGKISDVYYSGSLPGTYINELQHYKSLSNFNMEEIPLSNIEFGTICKKQFFVSVVGIKK